MKRILLLPLLFLSLTILAQETFETMKYRSVGPLRGGRVTTVAGTVLEPGTFYLGATGGGVWKTTDYGTSWKNVSDGYFKTPSIGAIAVSQSNKDMVYVGTGSDGIRSNVIGGKGMYKSKNGGGKWEFIGLENCGQIGAVEIDPRSDQVVYVAAIGQVFQPSKERGIYKTVDGGQSWSKIKFISERTGFADLELFPDNPNELIAAAWEVERKPWTIKSGGSEGGLFKSLDGGKSWKKLQKGLPKGLIGKIDIAISPSDPKLVYALVEADQQERGMYLSRDRGETFEKVSDKPELTIRPFYYTNVTVDPKYPNKLYVMATGYFRSDDFGKTWKRMRPPHGDNHDMWINPENPDLFIQANDGGANVTFNGGKTWSTQFNQNTSEIYQVEVDDQYPYWLYGGQQDNYSTVAVPAMPPYGVQAPDRGWIINTGGCETGPAVPKPGNADIVYANCKGRFSVYHKPSGTERRYDVGAANMYGHNPKELKFRFQRVSPIHVSPHDNNVVYHTSQYVHRTRDEGRTWEIISPDLTAFAEDKQVISGAPLTRDITGEEFYSTIYAIRESPVQQGVIWVGANDGPVHVTVNDGKKWSKVTPQGLPSGGRVDAVEPSPHSASKAYIAVLRYQLGDWKPYIYKTADFGKNWQLLTNGKNGIPADAPVRVIREDPERAGLLYAGTEYGLYISFDDGLNWQPFQQNLPVTPITDIKLHRGDLVLSTMGRGFYVLDHVYALQDLKTAAKGEMVADNQLLPVHPYVRYRSPKVRMGRNLGLDYPSPAMIIDYVLKEQPVAPVKLEIVTKTGEIVATVVSGRQKAGQVNQNADARVARSKMLENMSLNQVPYISDNRLTANQGLNRYRWDCRHVGTAAKGSTSGPMVSPGTYTIQLTIGDQVLTRVVEIKADPRVIESGVSIADIKAQESLALDVLELQVAAQQLQQKIEQRNIDMDNAGKLSKSEKELVSVYKQLVTKEGTYEKPMLIDQIKYLYYVVAAADQLPGTDAYARYEELQKALSVLQNKRSLGKL